MSVTFWLAIVSLGAVGVLFVTLVTLLHATLRELEAIGGSSTSLLAKIRLGRRAVETQAGHVPVELPKLNDRLNALAAALATAEGHFSRLADAQDRRP